MPLINFGIKSRYVRHNESISYIKISPHGLVPVLKIDDDALFESNAIVEYLYETVEPKMHPKNPIKRARNRAWTDFVPIGHRPSVGSTTPRTKSPKLRL